MSRALDNPINWSFRVGRVFAIDVRLHVLFVLGAVLVVFRSIGEGGNLWSLVYGVGQVGLLFAIVFTHELGHCFGARSTGGSADEVLLWPLGGLAYTNPPHTARANLITVLAGPAVNVVYLIVTAAALFILAGSTGALPLNPFDPYHTQAAITSELQWWFVMFFALNYVILLFNLMPVFPFDGGRVLQCLLWPRKGYAKATLIASGIGMVGAIVFGAIGLISGETLLIAIAFFGYFTCYQQRQMLKQGLYDTGNEFGYDFSQGFTSLEKESPPQRPSFLQRRRQKREAARQQRQREAAARRQAEIDRILEKVHQEGMSALTPRERAMLEEETQRQKSGD